MDIQKLIDDLLARNPNVARYIGHVRYVPQGQAWPAEATHALKLVNKAGDEVIVAFTTLQPYAAIADALLKVL